MDAARGAISSALRGEMAAQRVTYDRLTELTTLSKSTVVRYMTGARSVATEDFIQIAEAIGADPLVVFADALRHLRDADDPTLRQ